MKHQASKDIVVAALITDAHDRVLIVQAAHKDGWIFPGGYVEKDESPSDACIREVEAELGVRVNDRIRLLSVDYCDSSEEYIMFIFDCGTFTEQHIATIKLPPTLREYRFVSPEEAKPMLRKNSARRLAPTLAAREKTGIAYMEHEEVL
jgi:8-oxo-dGTP pyrophosphatase MutT (NUDIX family)